jgi:hypothetical protein
VLDVGPKSATSRSVEYHSSAMEVLDISCNRVHYEDPMTFVIRWRGSSGGILGKDDYFRLAVYSLMPFRIDVQPPHRV